ncbi:hypothetical protein N3K66_006261 [Trichothecium roseum]|uniref:Uncharacterized protein n=1 Tax=Trichothecium roseum TaxID=47278 RepID=A0ACC0V0X5_9HYPO|nr:hypothetical protein N3K66_006261 [Trichothecium roseum]
MDLLLSVPILSALFTPTWTTSMNILFFYGTWSTLVLTTKPYVIHAESLVVIRAIFWLLPSALFLLLDVGVPSIAGSLKYAGKAGLPPPTRKTARAAGLAVLNCVLVTAVESAASYVFVRAFGKPLFRTPTMLPLPWQVFKHVCLLLTVREVLTYYIHRDVLHGRRAGRLLSDLHRSHAHSTPASALQLYADHPLPLLTLHLAGTFLPAALLRPHLLTYMLFVLLTTIESTFSHSGYSFVPGVFLAGIARRNAVHYATRGGANYGAWGVLDWAHGTSAGGSVLQDARDEAGKHNLQERAGGKIDDGMSAVSEGVEGLRRSSRKRSTPKKSD